MVMEILGKSTIYGKVEDHSIKFFYQGKWRGVRYYSGKTLPSKRIIKEALATFILNTGQHITVEQVLPTIEWLV